MACTMVRGRRPVSHAPWGWRQVSSMCRSKGSGKPRRLPDGEAPADADPETPWCDEEWFAAGRPHAPHGAGSPTARGPDDTSDSRQEKLMVRATVLPARVGTGRSRRHPLRRSCILLAALLLSLAGSCGADAGLPGLSGQVAAWSQSHVPACLRTSPAAAGPHDTWTSVAPAPTKRYLLGATTGCDGTLYAMGGLAATSENPTPTDVALTDAMEAYDPAAGTWTAAAPLPTARVGLAAVTGRDGRIYAIGGSPNEQFPLRRGRGVHPRHRHLGDRRAAAHPAGGRQRYDRLGEEHLRLRRRCDGDLRRGHEDVEDGASDADTARTRGGHRRD